VGRRDDDDLDDVDDEVLEAATADANLRFGLSLLISLVLAGPVLWDAYGGRRALDDALLHYLLCFVVARIGIGVVGHVYSSYRRAQPPPATPSTAPARGARPVPGPLSESR
jgi:hypothetical protein